jgi:uncharacterized protein (TIGR02271 family)
MNETYSGLQRLSDTREFGVADDDPDIRGWDVVAGTQIVGEVTDLIVDPAAMKVRYVEVELDDDAFKLEQERRVLIPIASTDLNANAKQVIVTGISLEQLAGLPAFTNDSSTDDTRRPLAARESYSDASRAASAADTRREDTRLTRSEEELHVGKRQTEAGEVRVAKHVDTEHVREPVTVQRERVRIERRPVEHATARDISIGEDEIRVPIVGEEVVIDKRAVVKEELVISKERVEETEMVEADLRKERFDVTDTSHRVDTDASSGTRGRRS